MIPQKGHTKGRNSVLRDGPERCGFFGWSSLRVPKRREAEARDILRSVEEAKSAYFMLSASFGNGSSGGLSCDFSFFSISISDTRMAGDTADTGTIPDSAPQ